MESVRHSHFIVVIATQRFKIFVIIKYLSISLSLFDSLSTDGLSYDTRDVQRKLSKVLLLVILRLPYHEIA